MRIPNESLILVADGRKMLLYRNAGSAEAPDLRIVDDAEQPNPPDREQKSDLAGRRPAIGSGGGQASVSETNYHQQTEDDFARHIADHLNGLALRNQLLSLVVIAPAKVLGVLRKHFHQETRARIIAELEKDLTGHPTHRIADMLVQREEIG